MKLMNMAWRNLWRNRGRTVLSASAIFTGALVITLLVGFERGFVEDTISNVTGNLTGQVRVMNGEYVRNERVSPLQYHLADTEGLIAALRSVPGVRMATPRTDFGLAIYRKGEQIPVRALGLDFADSPVITARNATLSDGRLPSEGKNEVLVSAGLAKELGLAPGDRVTALGRTAINGSNGRTFTVAGILSLADISLVNRVVFMDWRLAADFLRMDGNALALHVFADPGVDEAKLAKNLPLALERAGFAGGVMDIRPWFDVNGMYSFFRVADAMYALISAIFFILASTVVINTTMMSVLERRREIGTLGALGMEKTRIVGLFLLESFFIALMGTLAGVSAGYIGVRLMGKYGIDVNAFGASSFEDMSVSQFIYPALPLRYCLYIALAGVAIALAACALPARMAASVESAEALRDK